MFADVNGVRTYYELTGPSGGRMIALCHSLGTSTALWDRQRAAAESAFAGMRILTYDVRGHGKSAVSPVDVSIELLAADFLALLDLLDIDRVVSLASRSAALSASGSELARRNGSNSSFSPTRRRDSARPRCGTLVSRPSPSMG